MLRADIKEICYRRLFSKSVEGDKKLAALFDAQNSLPAFIRARGSSPGSVCWEVLGFRGHSFSGLAPLSTAVAQWAQIGDKLLLVKNGSHEPWSASAG